MDSIATLKRTIRRSIIERILAMNPQERAGEDAALTALFPKLEGWQNSRCPLLFARAFLEEINTEPFLRASLEAGKRLVCPKVDRRAKCLRLFEINNLQTDFESGTLGIPEPGSTCRQVDPEEIDWVLVPGVAFDARGYRIGRGAGHYDRLLPRLRQDVPRWALIYEAQWIEQVPVEPHDVPVDGVASSSRIICP